MGLILSGVRGWRLFGVRLMLRSIDITLFIALFGGLLPHLPPRGGAAFAKTDNFLLFLQSSEYYSNHI
jgi:hypothetical protein